MKTGVLKPCLLRVPGRQGNRDRQSGGKGPRCGLGSGNSIRAPLALAAELGVYCPFDVANLRQLRVLVPILVLYPDCVEWRWFKKQSSSKEANPLGRVGFLFW